MHPSTATEHLILLFQQNGLISSVISQLRNNTVHFNQVHLHFPTRHKHSMLLITVRIHFQHVNEACLLQPLADPHMMQATR